MSGIIIFVVHLTNLLDFSALRCYKPGQSVPGHPDAGGDSGGRSKQPAIPFLYAKKTTLASFRKTKVVFFTASAVTADALAGAGGS